MQILLREAHHLGVRPAATNNIAGSGLPPHGDALRVDDVAPSGYARDGATIRQKKTGRPVWFELTDQTRLAVE